MWPWSNIYFLRIRKSVQNPYPTQKKINFPSSTLRPLLLLTHYFCFNFCLFCIYFTPLTTISPLSFLFFPFSFTFPLFSQSPFHIFQGIAILFHIFMWLKESPLPGGQTGQGRLALLAERRRQHWEYPLFSTGLANTSDGKTFPPFIFFFKTSRDGGEGKNINSISLPSNITSRELETFSRNLKRKAENHIYVGRGK